VITAPVCLCYVTGCSRCLLHVSVEGEDALVIAQGFGVFLFCELVWDTFGWMKCQCGHATPHSCRPQRGSGRRGVAATGSAARLRAPWDPIAGRHRAPDKKTIRVVLDRLDPRARALPGPRPRGRRRPGGPSPASVRGYHVRRAAQQTKMLARDRLRVRTPLTDIVSQSGVRAAERSERR
jgi:hypothetical protein